MMNNKNIFAKNLQRYMDMNNKSRKQICTDLGFSYYTFTDWVNGKKYPRMDKVEMLANYFGILKSDLIEEKMPEEKEKDNEIMADIIVRMRTDEDFHAAVISLYRLDPTKLRGVNEMLNAFQK
jgi:transcriptional regulator with XRE-family HTH domain